MKAMTWMVLAATLAGTTIGACSATKTSVRELFEVEGLQAVVAEELREHGVTEEGARQVGAAILSDPDFQKVLENLAINATKGTPIEGAAMGGGAALLVSVLSGLGLSFLRRNREAKEKEGRERRKRGEQWAAIEDLQKKVGGKA